MKSARSWITHQSIVCSIFIVNKRTDVSGIVVEPVLMSSLHCEAIRRAEERTCHSIVRFEVQFNVVVVDMWDINWAMALRSSSLMFLLWAACALSLWIGFCLRAGGRTGS